VKKIGLKSTWLQTYSASTIIIPNSVMSNTKVENLSFPYNKNLARIKVSVSYDSDVEKVKRVLTDLTKNTKHILKRPKPFVYLIELGDFALEFILVCPIKDMKYRFEIIEKINCRIIKKFREENINIPFPTQISHVDITKDNFKELKNAVCRRW
ncbi:MAG: mechanosensitive ion channel, partial [Candidatus Aenigmarchaeota archaeon]|nr:mechanosensitive ion channel [Candidatus Aenigmarchaeota archaeon]